MTQPEADAIIAEIGEFKVYLVERLAEQLGRNADRYWQTQRIRLEFNNRFERYLAEHAQPAEQPTDGKAARSYKAGLHKRLQDPVYALAYLQECADEAETFKLALGDVLAAMSEQQERLRPNGEHYHTSLGAALACEHCQRIARAAQQKELR
jgi:hypothetical protein